MHAKNAKLEQLNIIIVSTGQEIVSINTYTDSGKIQYLGGILGKHILDLYYINYWNYCNRQYQNSTWSFKKMEFSILQFQTGNLLTFFQSKSKNYTTLQIFWIMCDKVILTKYKSIISHVLHNIRNYFE